MIPTFNIIERRAHKTKFVCLTIDNDLQFRPCGLVGIWSTMWRTSIEFLTAIVLFANLIAECRVVNKFVTVCLSLKHVQVEQW